MKKLSLRQYLVSPANTFFLITNETEHHYICRNCVYVPKSWVTEGKWTLCELTDDLS